MASLFEGALPNPYQPAPNDPGVIGDLGLGAGAGFTRLGGQLGSFLRWAGESRDDPNDLAAQAAIALGKYVQNEFGNYTEDLEGMMSPEALRGMQSSFSDPEFWSVMGFAMKGANMAPEILAGIGSGLILPGVMPALVGAAAVNGVSGAGEVLDEMYAELDSLSYEDLETEPAYQKYIEQGMQPEEARAAFNQEFIGARPAIAAAVGLVTGAFGVTGKLAGLASGAGASITGEVGEGIMRRTARGAGETFISEGIQEGSQEYLQQQAGVELGMQEGYELSAIIESFLTGATVGGVIGGAASAPGPLRGTSRADQNENAPETELEDATVLPAIEVTADGNDAVPGVVGTEPAPAPVTPSGTSAVPGVISQDVELPSQVTTDADVTPAAPASPAVTVVDAVSPDPAQSIAIAANTPQPPVAAPAAPTTQPTQPAQDMSAQPAPVEQAPVETQPTPVETQPLDTGPVEEAVPPVANSPVPVETVQQVDPDAELIMDPEPDTTPDGRRILEDQTQDGPSFLDQIDAQINQIINGETQQARRLEVEADPLRSTAEKGSNLSKKALANRARVRETASEVLQDDRFAPAEIEAHYASPVGRLKAKGRETMINRAVAIDDLVRERGLELPERLSGNANERAAFNPETLLLMEARRIANMHRSGRTVPQAALSRFFERELDIRSGAGREAIIERREEGNRAKKVISETAEGESIVDRLSATNLTDDIAEATADTSTPENVLLRREELEQSDAQPVLPNQKQKTYSRPVTEGKSYTAGRDVTPPKVETRRKRVIKKPEPAKQIARPTEAAMMSPDEKSRLRAQIGNARANTDPNPTEAQKRSGNYKKGRVSVYGMQFVMETPRGAMRRGPGWEVKSPTDYGYIANTRGADGDQIDVHLGTDYDATYVYVVDQLDADTGLFDEHKVFMFVDNEAKARKLYERSFSDGRAGQRFGDMRQMSVAEFKRWLEQDPKSRRAGVSEELANESVRIAVDNVMETASEAGMLGGDNWVRTNNGHYVQPLRTVTGREAISGLSRDGLTGVRRAMYNGFSNMLSKHVGGVKLHYVSGPDMEALWGKGGRPLGVWQFDDKTNTERIYILDDIRRNPQLHRHAVIHEMAHAATQLEIANNAGLRKKIDLMRDLLRKHADGLDGPTADLVQYALHPSHGEFIAELFGNKDLQRVLMGIELSRADAQTLGLMDARTLPLTIWDGLVSMVRRALRIPRGSHTLLEGAMRVAEQSFVPTQDVVARFNSSTAVAELSSALGAGNIRKITDMVRNEVAQYTTRKEFAPTVGRPWLLGLRTLDHISRAADKYFGKDNPVRKIYQLIEKQGAFVRAQINASGPMLQKLYDLERKYSVVPGQNGQSVWENFTTLTSDETMSGVYADRPLDKQPHISKKGAADSWARKQHPDLAARYRALPDDLKEARREALQYYRDQQNTMSYELIRNRIVRLFDTADPDGLARRIHEGTTTEADAQLMGEALDVIKAAGVLSRIEGPYFPLMRRGNYVVKGRQPVTPPSNATAISRNEFEFKSKDAATSFMERQSGRPTLRTVYVDPATGKTTAEANGETVKLTAQDMNVEPRYRVVVQDEFMEMFDTEAEARDHVAVMRQKGFDVDDAVPRRFEYHGMQADMLSTQMQRMNTVLERRGIARGLTEEQIGDMLSTLNEASLSLLGPTRIASRALPRRYVAGASKDFTRNAQEYSVSAANYIGKLKYRPEIEREMQALDQAVKASPQDGMAAARTAIQNEVVRRVNMPNPTQESGPFTAGVNRLMTISFIDKLASPSYSVINATQPMMITAPYLSSRFGVGRAYSAMARAYNDLGSMKAIREGVTATALKARHGNSALPSDPVELIKSRLKNARERELIDVMVERGVMGNDAGFEVDKLIKANKGIMGQLDRGVGYLEGMARQMPKTVEAINRGVSALAAYRLEMERSGDHAKAIQFAQDTVDLTQFNYSSSNAPAYFNHPMLRMALQFKKYGMGMYQFMGEQVAIAYHNANPGDRAQALKALSYTIGMHALVAGAMGLPTEPIKLVVTAANGLGVIGWTWEDVEVAQREAAAGLFGKDVGEVISRGLPRAVGLDLSGRLGIDTLMGPFGEPRSNEAQDYKAWLFDFVAGAPAGYVVDVGKGINSLATGDVSRAMERLVPIKMFADSVKAYRQMTEGTVSERTGRQVMSPYSVGEAVTKALGFQPARESEGFERSSMFYRGRDAQAQSRNEFQREWAEASGAARGRIWREIQKYNRTVPKEAQITMRQLRAYQRRVKEDLKNTQEGIRARRNEQHYLDRANAIYGYEP